MIVEKNVPQIRFNGFDGEWRQRKLDTIFGRIRNAFVGTATPYYVKEGNFYLESNNIKDGKINRKNEIFINDYFYQKQSDKWLREGDIVMVQSGHVGHTAVIPPELNNIAAHALIMFTDPKEKISPHFLNFQFQTDKVKTKLSEITTGNTIKHILSSEMKEFEVHFTKCEEQTQIGNYFQKLDNLINQHQQKHDKLSSIKKAMLEKMFPKQGETVPEIRFKGFGGEWRESNLSECTDLLTGNPFNSKQFTSDGIFLVRGMNVKRGYLDTSPNLSEYWPSSKGLERYLLESEDIVIQMDGALIGKSYAKIHTNNLPAILVQRVTRVRCSEVNPEFIYQYIQKDFLSHISGIKTETAVPHLSLHDIRAFSVFLPERPEQNAIGNYFQKFDSLINQHQQQITKLNNIKQACLSKMFV